MTRVPLDPGALTGPHRGVRAVGGGRVGVAPTSQKVRVARVSDETTPNDDGDALREAEEAIADARRRVAEAPADVVVANHVMGLYELAAIHLSAPTPHLGSAALAIDAMALLVDGLGDRLGDPAAALRDALGNIRMAFVQIKGARSADPPAGGDPAG